MIYLCDGSWQFEEEGEEFVVLQGVGEVDMLKGRDQIDQISCGYNDACFLFFNEITNILLKGLGVARVGRTEPAREDIVVAAECLLNVTSVGHVQHRLQLHRLLVNAVKIYLSLALLVPREETAPVRLKVLVLIILSASVDVQDVPDLVDLVLLLGGVIRVGGGIVGEGIDGGWQGRGGSRLGGLGSLRVLLAFSLVSQLIVDIGVKSRNFIVVDQNSNLALAVSQLFSLLLHFLTGTQCLRQGFVFHQHVGPLCWQLVAFYLQVSYIAKT